MTEPSDIVERLGWHPIETAPTDGSVVRVTTTQISFLNDLYSFRAKFIEGQWLADFGNGNIEDWKPFTPQPMYWKSEGRGHERDH